jgi:biotin carboxyl carrier protein
MSMYEVFVDGKLKRVEVSRIGEAFFTVKVDGEAFTVQVPEGKPIYGRGFQVKVNDKAYTVLLAEISKTKPFTVKVEEVSFQVELRAPPTHSFTPVTQPTFQRLTIGPAKPKQTVSGTVTAPMTGKIISIKVKKGDHVKAGQVLCILEAMKMENEITAPVAGTVREILVSEGASVNEGDPLFVVS